MTWHFLIDRYFTAPVTCNYNFKWQKNKKIVVDGKPLKIIRHSIYLAPFRAPENASQILAVDPCWVCGGSNMHVFRTYEKAQKKMLIWPE